MIGSSLSPSRLLNGERAVVMLFIGCIFFSLPVSLLLHGVVLSAVSLLSLCVELRAESSSSSLSQFKTRPGASSGIFLGAVTLPAVMLSKLIQLSRAFSLHQIEFEELNYLSMQYWATSASCFSVLIFLCWIMWHSNGSVHHAQHKAWDVIFSLSCIVLCATILILSGSGMQTAELLWVIVHGFVAVKLVQHLLDTFPSCASIGEAFMVTIGLVIYFGDMLACTTAKFDGYWVSSKAVLVESEIRRSEISTVIQGLLLGLLLFPVIFKFVLHMWECFYCGTNFGAGACSERGKALLFFASLGLIMVLIVPSWMQFVQNFQVHPFLWVITYVFSEPLKRLSLCIYWVSVIYVSVLRFYSISKSSKIERILLRKYYHLMAVLMFLPAVIFQPKFLDLALGAALAVFLTLEIIRVWRIWPLGQLIHQFMNAFTDHRDSDLLIVSHFSLLLGCALPIWMSSGYNDRPLAPFAGILSLGIGDTMASMVGYKYGVLRWSKSGKKTIEGTAAGITSVLAACSVLLPILASAGYIFTQHWVSLLLAVIVSGLLEAYTAQLDNAFIPLVFYSLLCL
ncbi:dolichol kinase EVAN [Mercurialis annua]|uniref:dolichol kinase EVAN n=1 Tax=Mercurialis annua TaxID=3986 RepID=UPI00215E3E22|nr:dolichol kinase EVAN [Mercurialis annua]XP_050214022.1 dolichol kinase EVAN [Mercurialis annua]XP_050214023.1 dolichol kinase EVAN [Mercurialis annua]